MHQIRPVLVERSGFCLKVRRIHVEVHGVPIIYQGEDGALASAVGLFHGAQRCRGLGKRDMKLNAALPRIEVDPESYE